MSRGGYYLPCPPVLYYVPDRGGVQPPAAVEQPLDMDVQLRSPAPFHYLIHEQAKSLVVLQELQNEVGALLEFRDVVMETFPHLRSKMVASEPARVHTTASGGAAPRIKAKVRPPSSTAPAAASPPAVVAGAGWRDWGPGVRVRRKLKEPEAKKTAQRQPKSGGGGGGSGGEASSGGTASGSTVQDSGFSTETKDLHSSGTVTGPKSGAATSAPSESGRPASSTALTGEDELWELLEVIQRKGTRLRREVEELQTRLESGESSEGGEGEVRRLRRERDLLLRRVAEMEAEAAGSEARVSRLQDEAGNLTAQRRELEERLRVALSRKPETDPRALSSRSVRGPGGSRRGSSVGAERSSSGRASPCTPGRRATSAAASPPAAPDAPAGREEGGRVSRSSSFRAAAAAAKKEAWEWPPTLGALDGLVSNPQEVTAASRGARRPDPKVIAAILKEENVLELRRHLLVTAMERETLRHKLEWVSMWRGEASTDLEKTKEENEDLRFQLEEKSIELEGTRARIRMLESRQERADTAGPSTKQTPNGFSSSTVPKEDINGSSTESAHYVASASEAGGTRGRVHSRSSMLRTPPPSSRTPPTSRTPPSSRTPPLPSQSRSQSRTGRVSRIPLPPPKARSIKAPPSPVPRGGSKSGESMSSVSTLAAHRTDSSRKPTSITSDGGKSAANTRVICLPHHRNIASYRGTLNQSTRCSQNPAVLAAEHHPFPDSLNASSAHPEYFDSVENRPWLKRKTGHQDDFLSPTTSELSEAFDLGRPVGEGIYSPLADSLDDLPSSALGVEQCEDTTQGVPNLWEVFGAALPACSSKVDSPR